MRDDKHFYFRVVVIYTLLSSIQQLAGLEMRKNTPVAQEYYLGNAYLQRVQEEKYLGVTMSCNLSWDSHVTCIAHKANRMLGLLKRTCPLITDFKVRWTLYLSLSEVTALLCHRGMVSCKCPIENDPRKSPEACYSLDTKG